MSPAIHHSHVTWTHIEKILASMVSLVSIILASDRATDARRQNDLQIERGVLLRLGDCCTAQSRTCCCCCCCNKYIQSARCCCCCWLTFVVNNLFGRSVGGRSSSPLCRHQVAGPTRNSLADLIPPTDLSHTSPPDLLQDPYSLPSWPSTVKTNGFQKGLPRYTWFGNGRVIPNHLAHRKPVWNHWTEQWQATD